VQAQAGLGLYTPEQQLRHKQQALVSSMTIKFLLLVNKQGQTRLAKYFTELLSTDEKRALEGEIVRKCLARTDKQVYMLISSLQQDKHITQHCRTTHQQLQQGQMQLITCSACMCYQ
jgi:hypothetical protein